MNVISIVPRLHPAIDGVGDYSLHLARQLRKEFGIETQFIVGDPNWEGSTMVEGFAVGKLETRSTSAFLSLLTHYYPQSTTILLQFSGYGYAKWACPFWLLDGLKQWKTKIPNARLITMFHEIYNSLGAPWQHNFWVSDIQKHLARRLTCLSDSCLTSRQQYAKTLFTFSRGQHTQIPTLPIYSNTGEPDQILPLAQREKRLVIFGQRGTRLRAYQKSVQTLKQICRELQIQEIVDIGPALDLNLSKIGEVPVIELGQLPSSEISEILQRSIAGFLHYETQYLAKSGTFAAYCAHGLLPILHEWGTSTDDGIAAGKQYWAVSSNLNFANSIEELQSIAGTAHAWYQSHCLSVHAQMFCSLLI